MGRPAPFRDVTDYGNLRAAFPGQRKLVESFFLKRERSPKKSQGSGGGSADEG